MSPSERRRSNREENYGGSNPRAGRRTRGLSFKTAVEQLEPRCMLAGQAITDIAIPTIRLDLANPLSGASPAATGGTAPSANSYSPTEISNLYSFNQVTFSGGTVQGNGAGQTIAIVDAYQDPGIANDAMTFSTQYSLPQFGSVNGPTLTIANQTGGSVTSVATDPTNDDWALETSLDVEWVHALAPQANILLVESNSDGLSDLLAGVQYATTQSTVSVVSMSWGAPETAITNEPADDTSYFTTPAGHQGITFVTSAGDTGTPGGYPAYSPNVLSVGGTTLNSGQSPSSTYSTETVWNDGINSTTNTLEATGGGISTKEAEPAYQKSVVPAGDSQNGTLRAMPDVAFDADPVTGVGIVDSYDYGTGTGWVQVGGTSFGAPAWAAIIAVADQGRVISGLGPLDGASQTLPEIYAMPSTNFHDITTGTNSTYSATTGYDLVTGRGTPIVSSVNGSLDTFNVSATTPVVGSTVQTPPTSFTVTFSDPYSTTMSAPVAADFEVNGVQATSLTETSSTQITFTFSTSPVLSNQLTQTMTVVAGTIVRAADGTPLTAFTGTFNEDSLPQITVASITPASGSTVAIPMTSVTVQFSEAYAPGSISNSNLTLSQGSVTGFTLVNSTTVTYSLSGLTNPGTVTVTIAGGAVTDTNGGPSASFTATYFLTSGLLSGIPAGSMVYETSTGGTITSGSESQYSLSAAAGETITALVVPGTLSFAKLNISGPGVLKSASGTNKDVILQTVSVATAGTFLIGVFSPGGGTGTFTINIFLNAAVSTAAIGGAAINQRTSAQDLTASFESMGPTASRGAVIGVTSSSTASDYYSFKLAAGQTVSLGVADQSAATGTIGVSLLNSSGVQVAAGTAMTTNVDSAVENFTATTTGTYYAQVTGNAANITYVLVVTRGADFDFKGNSAEAAAQNITGTAGVLGAILSAAPTDWYAVNLAAGAGVTLQTYSLGGTTANSEVFVDALQPQIQLYSPSGTLIASGTGSTNQSITANASVAGTYFVEVTGSSGSSGEYFLGLSTAPTVSITPILPSPTNAAVSQMQIVFSGPVSGMSLADLSLSLNGGSNLLTASQTLTTTNDTTFTLTNLALLTGGNGVYTLSAAASSGIKNQNNISLQSGASTTFTVDTTPPDVTGVYVSGTSWSQTFLSYLASQGLGSAQLGYLIPTGANQLADLPWVNLDTISIVFNENVSINTADSTLQLIGSPDLPPSAQLSGATFSYSTTTHTAQWFFSSPLTTDKYLLSIPSVDVSDSLGSTLDGEWTTASSNYPSGNGTAGGAFNFRFNIVKADVLQDATVSGLDANDPQSVRQKLLQNTTTSSYSAFYDLLGSGAITGADSSYVRVNLANGLPATDPTIPGGGGNAIVAAIPVVVAGEALGNSSSDNLAASASQPAGSSSSSQLLSVGSSTGPDQLSIGPSSIRPLGGGSWPTALKLITVAPTDAAPSTPTGGASDLPVVGRNLTDDAFALEIAFDSKPRADQSKTQVPVNENPPAAAQFAETSRSMPLSIEAFAASVAAHGDDASDGISGNLDTTPSDVPASNPDLADDSAAWNWLTDLVLEQGSEWLGE